MIEEKDPDPCPECGRQPVYTVRLLSGNVLIICCWCGQKRAIAVKPENLKKGRRLKHD